MEREDRRIAHYRLTRRIGEGAMGVVYRARDERLERDVALKLVLDAMIGDTAARGRLLREARLASALNHPNVCTVHEVGDAGGETFVVMELVEGEPLASVIPPEGLPATTVCRYGAQIADALDHAHRKGVIHRDLKPSNLMITPEGRVKVLDFGLSRRSPGVAGAIDSTATRAGTWAGTPLYLPPEVWHGGKADERSDLWALGAVLYQMAAGRVPFAGANEYEVSAAIMNLDPPPLPDRVPLPLAALIGRCLQKDARLRPGSAAEVRSALETLAPDPTRATRASRPGLRGRWLLAGAASVLAAVVVGIAAHRKPAVTRQPRQLTFNSAENAIAAAAISPDGRYLAYVDREGIQLRLLEGGETRSLPLPEGWTTAFPVPVPQLSWHPDGSHLFANAGDGLWEISVQAGAPRLQVEGTAGGIVSPDGRQLAYAMGGALCRTAVGGGDPDTLVWLPGAVHVTSPAWSPDGRWIAFLDDPTGTDRGAPPVRGNRLWCLDTRTRRAAPVWPDSLVAPYAGEHRLTWSADARLIFQRDDGAGDPDATSLWCVRMDLRTGRPRGRLERLTRLPGGAAGYPSVSSDGKRLAFLQWGWQSDVWVSELEPDGDRLGEPRRLTLDDRMDTFSNWTPDGDGVLFSSNRNGNADVFVQRLDRAGPTVLVSGPENESGVRMTPDGSALVYMSSPSGARVATKARRLQVPLRGGLAREIGDTLVVRGGFGAGLRQVVIDDDAARSTGTLLVVLATDSGNGPRALARVDRIVSSVALSPDSTRVALIRRGTTGSAPQHITIVDLASGAQRSIGLGDGLGYEDVSWMPDGRHLIGVASLGDEEVIYRRGLEGRATVLWRTRDVIFGARPSPDGRRVAFTRGGRCSNAWILEGL